MTAAPRPKPFRLTAPGSPLEHQRQKLIADVLRIEIAAPGRVSRAGVVWWSCDIADYGGSAPGARMARGVVAGVADMFFLWLGRAHFIELKTEDGSLSDAQRAIAAAVLASGGRTGVARTAEEVLQCLDRWEIPRARRVQGGLAA